MTILLGLLLLPVLFRNMPKEELGMWLLIAQTASLMGILDFGFQETLTRRIAFAKAQSGSDPTAPLNDKSRADVADLVSTGIRIYRVIAGLTIVIAFGFGSLYLIRHSTEAVPSHTLCIAWGVICVSQAITFMTAPWISLLLGVGYVGWESILASLVNVLTLTGQIVVALLGGGLVGLAVVTATGAFTQRVVLFGFARRKRPDLFQVKGRWKSESFRSMIPFASRAWVMGIGCSLILYTDQFVIVSLMGAQDLPAYRAAWVLVHHLTNVAVTLGGASAVFVSHLWKEGDLAGVHRILDRNVRLGWITMLTGAGVLIFAGEPLFTLWLGPGNFVGYTILLAFITTQLLEVQSQNISYTSRATEDEAFAWSTLIAGAVKLGLSIELGRRFGLVGIAVGTMIALACTNHVYIPYRGLSRLRFSRREYVTRSLLPCFGYLGFLAAVLYGVKLLTEDYSALVKVLATMTLATMAFLSGLWIMILDKSQRQQFLDRVKRQRFWSVA